MGPTRCWLARVARAYYVHGRVRRPSERGLGSKRGEGRSVKGPWGAGQGAAGVRLSRGYEPRGREPTSALGVAVQR